MKTTLKITALALLTALVFTGCKKEFTVTVKANNPEWGTVSGGGTYADGETVTIAATPNSGYYFSSWLDGDKSNPRQVVVTANITYTAVFTDDPNGGGGDPNDPMQMSGTISENVTWADRGLPVDYIVDGTIDITGNALLTIAPGVTIMFTGVNGGMVVGENAGIKMVGTADKPIVFQGPTNNPNNGSWYGITIHSTRSDNQFEYVQFLRGGSGETYWEGVVNVNGRLSMKHCTIDGSLKNGLTIDDGYMNAFEGNTIKNCGASPFFTANFAAACKNIGTGNTFSANAENRIHVAGSGYLESENLTLHYVGIPYFLQVGGFYGENRTLTIEAGVVIEVPANTNLNVPADLCFVADGTADKPIVFRATDGADWNGLTFFSQRSGNSISYCQFQKGGRGDDWDNRACLYIGGDAKLALANCTFGPSQHYGVSIENIGNWGNVSHNGNTFTGCQGGNVYIDGGGEYGGTEYEGGEVLDALP